MTVGKRLRVYTLPFIVKVLTFAPVSYTHLDVYKRQVYSMLIICSISHFLNDMIQSIIPSIYPIVKG